MAGLATGGQTRSGQPGNGQQGSGQPGSGQPGNRQPGNRQRGSGSARQAPSAAGGAHARQPAPRSAARVHDTVKAPGRLASLLHTTPGRVRVGVAAIVLVACGLGVLVALTFGGVNSGFTAIGGTEAPLVEQSTGLYFSVNDMDAQVANVLLDGVSTNQALTADRAQDQTVYANDEAQAEHDLQQVTATSAGNPAAQSAVSTVLSGLSRYEALAADAILTNQNGNDPPGHPSAATLNYYQQATDLMQNTVLPAAYSLTNANGASLDSTYSGNHSAAQHGAIFVLLLGVLLIALLVVVQVFLTRRYRRLINPGLAAATLVALGLTAIGVVQLGAMKNQLYVAKVQAFDSIQALTVARAVSYDANADESRYLVDPARALQYQNDYLVESQQLANVGNVGIFQYDAALAADINAYKANNADVKFGGYLGTEFDNITFPGERAAAVNALLAYQVYERDDRALRAMAKTNLDAAIMYDVGTSPGQSDYAFNAWDTALGSVITINEKAFASAINAGHSDGSGWNGLFPGLAVVAITAAAVAGVRRRLAEYR
jgi:hypothetical protein